MEGIGGRMTEIDGAAALQLPVWAGRHMDGGSICFPNENIVVIYSLGPA